nr:hypothetical protein [Tanacetum cinerariifolium]
MPQCPSSTPFVPPTRNDWDTLLQLLFDEYFRPPSSVDHPITKVAALEPVVSTSTPSSTSVNQDAPSPTTSRSESHNWPTDNRLLNPRNGNIPNLIITITHYLSNLIVTKLDGTKKVIGEIGELRAVSDHMLGASRVKIPQNNLDNLQSKREEDGTLEIVDLLDCVGSEALEILDSIILYLLLVPIVFVSLGFDPLAPVEHITLVDCNKGSANLTFLSLFSGITATNFSLGLVKQENVSLT